MSDRDTGTTFNVVAASEGRPAWGVEQDTPIEHYWSDRTAALAEALHQNDGTQHLLTQHEDQDGDITEVIECLTGEKGHEQDAKDALLYLREHGWTLEREETA